MSFIEFPQSGNEDKEEGNFFDLRFSERTTSRRQGKIFGRQKGEGAMIIIYTSDAVYTAKADAEGFKVKKIVDLKQDLHTWVRLGQALSGNTLTLKVGDPLVLSNDGTDILITSIVKSVEG